MSTAGSYNNVILSNDQITSGFTIGNTYEVSCFAKADTNQQFKFRIKCLVGGITTFLTSPSIQLSNTYSLYNYSFTIPNNTTEMQFQILCGKDLGNYFFDEFNVTNSTLSLSDSVIENDFILYPNPFNNFIEIDTHNKIDSLELLSIDGRSIEISRQNNKILVSDLSSGIYILKITSNSKTYFKKVIHE